MKDETIKQYDVIIKRWYCKGYLKRERYNQTSKKRNLKALKIHIVYPCNQRSAIMIIENLFFRQPVWWALLNTVAFRTYSKDWLAWSHDIVSYRRGISICSYHDTYIYIKLSVVFYKTDIVIIISPKRNLFSPSYIWQISYKCNRIPANSNVS